MERARLGELVDGYALHVPAAQRCCGCQPNFPRPRGGGVVLGGGRPLTWAITLLLLGLSLVVAGYAVRARWDGIFVDRDNRISLSRFQLVIWTVLLVGSLFTAGLTNAVDGDTANGALQIEIPPQLWALLGLGALTAVAAPAIKDTKRASGAPAQAASAAQQTAVASQVQADQKLGSPPSFDGQVLVKQEANDARWLDMIRGDYAGSAHVDSSKLQQLAFTVLLVCVYAADLRARMGALAPITALPTVDEGFLALLSISHAAYLADKQLAST